jgi:hypothetical protein
MVAKAQNYKKIKYKNYKKNLCTFDNFNNNFLVILSEATKKKAKRSKTR